MVRIDKNKLKQFVKMCILEDDKICDNCCECFVCELDPTKTCDNCARCLELADYNYIPLEEIIYKKGAGGK